MQLTKKAPNKMAIISKSLVFDRLLGINDCKLNYDTAIGFEIRGHFREL